MRYYRVIVYVATHAEPKEVESYVYDAVSSWGGQFRPDDDLFPSNTLVEVTDLNELRKRPRFWREDEVREIDDGG